MKLQDYPEVAIEGAPGFTDFTGWMTWSGETPYGDMKAVVCAEWEGKIETYVFDMTYIKEI